MIAGFSTTTLLLLATKPLGRLGWSDLTPRGELLMLYRSVLVGSLLLYPMSLGLGPFDPYSLGFSGAPVLLLAMAVLAAVAFVAGKRFLLASVLAAVLAFGLELGTSQNLWDYLLDPWLLIYATYRLVRERFTIV